MKRLVVDPRADLRLATIQFEGAVFTHFYEFTEGLCRGASLPIYARDHALKGKAPWIPQLLVGYHTVYEGNVVNVDEVRRLEDTRRLSAAKQLR